jgi:hypothetical protein
VPVVIFLAAAVILGGVVVVAMGRGGELSRERPELASRSDFRTWSDIARYRPPAALLGYHAGATEHALSLIARTLAERDAEIDWLRKRLAEVQPESVPDDLTESELTSAGAVADPGAGIGLEPGYGEVASGRLPGYAAEPAAFHAQRSLGTGSGEDE